MPDVSRKSTADVYPSFESRASEIGRNVWLIFGIVSALVDMHLRIYKENRYLVSHTLSNLLDKPNFIAVLMHILCED